MTYLISYILIFHGELAPMRTELTEAQFSAFKRDWSHGVNCPGPDCAQITGVKVKEIPAVTRLAAQPQK